MGITCLFVDLGDVIFKINPLKANENLKTLGLPIKFGPEQHSIIDFFEIGAITPKEFLSMMKEYCPQKSLSDKNIIDAFNSILEGPGFMVERLEYLLDLKRKHPQLRIYLLSNTNEIHIKRIQEQAGIQNVTHLFGDEKNSGLFNDRFFSCRLQARKPESLIYHKVCELAQVNPSEALLIDDNHQNIMAAEAYGMQTIELKTTDLKSFISVLDIINVQ